MPWSLILLVAAFVLFVVAVWKEKTFTAAGLACLALALIALQRPFL